MKQYFWGSFYFLWNFSTQASVAFGVFSSVYAVWLKSPNALVGRLYQITHDDFTEFSILQIMYENYYHEQLVKSVWNTSMLIVDVFCRDTFCSFVSGTQIPVIFSMLYFPGFITASYHFPWCFRMFRLVFLRLALVFFPQCFTCFVF